MKAEIDAKLAYCKTRLERLDLEIANAKKERAQIQDYMDVCADSYSLFDEVVEPVDNPHKHFMQIKLKKGSFAFKARQLILDNGAPMHIDDICKAIYGKDVPKSKIGQHRGNINHLCSQMRVFVRVAPGIYNLMEKNNGKG